MGVMGRGMAGALARAGLRTTVWDRRPEVAGQGAPEGTHVATDLAEAVRGADVVITMVTDADAVLAVAETMLPGMDEGALWAQMSTIGVDGIERAARLVAERRPDITLLDAPVAGSRVPAEKGALTVFASGPSSVRDRVGPVFDAVGARTVWVGETGAGTRVKLVNNLVLAFAVEGLAESLALADALGLDQATVLEVLDGSPLISPWAAQKLARIARDDYSPEYALSLGLKDVELARAEEFPAAERILDTWRTVVADGHGSEDVTVVVRELRTGRHT
jgi:3-hydroxyisobutyrate dehydrogenase